MLTIEPRGHDVTAVLFAGLAERRAVYEWWGTFRDIPANVVAIRDPHFAWWQVDTLKTAGALCDAIGQAGGGRTVALGASAGGFGALLFGALCGFDAVLAFCPQTVVGKAKRDIGDHRWPERCKPLGKGPYSDIAALKLPPATIHYASDDRLDCLHAERVPGVTLARHGQGGHNLPERLRDAGKLRGIVAAALAPSSHIDTGNE